MTSRAVVLALDDEAAAHLALALGAHLQLLRRNGRRPPALVSELFQVFAALSGRQRPTLGGVGDGADDDPVLLAYSQVARRLRVSERTVRRMVVDGRLPVTAIGRRRLVPAAAVERFGQGDGRSSWAG